MNATQLIARLSAIASPHRFRIIAALAGETLHVSELARRLQMSRALLYMHLQRLEEQGYVSGHLELSDDGKALKFFEVVPFDLSLDVPAIVAAVESESQFEAQPEAESRSDAASRSASRSDPASRAAVSHEPEPESESGSAPESRSASPTSESRN
ncbi:winged helix-turn-helix domain-containing protein [Microbacterium sp. STN6]|uniref:ArsR/SmtB family transcription factor n=1 Tax=Microbacterium sp. STN6 TaxID=2995588 RepID=UPI002260DA54|nr:winged helix-turn-helix domain-containing protein [Microbacterium sp. STN6]MCX7522151.1 winged helix-turn-helix domain-containing protein [Microbacterium sp. STN6]